MLKLLMIVETGIYWKLKLKSATHLFLRQKLARWLSHVTVTARWETAQPDDFMYYGNYRVWLTTD